jgi:hypothetical protein
VVAEDGGADGPCKKTDGIGRKCGDGAKRSYAGREEELVENQRRCGGVNEEVVPFDCRAMILERTMRRSDMLGGWPIA